MELMVHWTPKKESKHTTNMICFGPTESISEKPLCLIINHSQVIWLQQDLHDESEFMYVIHLLCFLLIMFILVSRV